MRPNRGQEINQARLMTEFYAENGIGHCDRLFDRFGVPLSEGDLVRNRNS
jgi:hypothetical protein